ncbi:response regulator [Sphingobacterium oryzagri]|uniref:Response regulator n=1 Tax=Sphingobacterium oryzagri TaxID=3025669 RepID=A0ABY7WLQ0_9SPHI|nr:response regulator [Sphingobacterium sp. KACC 22765]WDF70531.1 response regulator [Sphingobacterium sp. KACC 22765]
MNKHHILVIEDEPQIRKLLEINLVENGYRVSHASTGREGLLLAATHLPDLILLDLGLPDMDGQDLIKELRSWYGKAVIVLSVQHSESAIVTALDNGATDYLSKPFRMGELSARIRSAIRQNNGEEPSPVMQLGDLDIDLIGRVVKKEAAIIKLTTTEFNLLALLARNEGRVLTHQYILREIWGVGFQTETQYLRVYVAQLRKKIENDPNSPQHIITESGVGYRFQ